MRGVTYDPTCDDSRTEPRSSARGGHSLVSSYEHRILASLSRGKGLMGHVILMLQDAEESAYLRRILRIEHQATREPLSPASACQDPLLAPARLTKFITSHKSADSCCKPPRSTLTREVGRLVRIPESESERIIAEGFRPAVSRRRGQP
jgi:hypothetical protein